MRNEQRPARRGREARVRVGAEAKSKTRKPMPETEHAYDLNIEAPIDERTSSVRREVQACVRVGADAKLEELAGEALRTAHAHD